MTATPEEVDTMCSRIMTEINRKVKHVIVESASITRTSKTGAKIGWVARIGRHLSQTA
jgi:hypothetical protein